jgi:transcriptional regulator
LVSHDGKYPQATHFPFHLEEREEGLYLSGHFAFANQHWKSVHDEEVLVIFPGPHTYISSSWYEENGTVPTWNYTVVHVYGKCTILQDQQELIHLLRQSVAEHEANIHTPWDIDEHMDTVKGMLKGIVGFRIHVSKIEAKEKLSQHHPKERQKKVIHQLEHNYHLYDSKQIAKLMKKSFED